MNVFGHNDQVADDCSCSTRGFVDACDARGRDPVQQRIDQEARPSDPWGQSASSVGGDETAVSLAGGGELRPSGERAFRIEQHWESPGTRQHYSSAIEATTSGADSVIATGVLRAILAGLQTRLSLEASKLVEVCQTRSESFFGIEGMARCSDGPHYNDPAPPSYDAEIAACVAHVGCAVPRLRSDQRNDWAGRIRPSRSAVETAQ